MTTQAAFEEHLAHELAACRAMLEAPGRKVVVVAVLLNDTGDCALGASAGELTASDLDEIGKGLIAYGQSVQRLGAME